MKLEQIALAAARDDIRKAKIKAIQLAGKVADTAYEKIKDIIEKLGDEEIPAEVVDALDTLEETLAAVFTELLLAKAESQEEEE